jgi:hypothetical protein
VLEITADRDVGADFAMLPLHRLSVVGTGEGSGRLTSDDGEIDCAITAGTTNGACTAEYPRWTTVRIRPEPTSGSAFTGWSGACSGASPDVCILEIDGDLSVGANFDLTFRLQSISPRDGYIGSEVVLTGFELGQGGSVLVDGAPISPIFVDEWTNSTVTIRLPDIGDRGIHRFSLFDRRESNSLLFTLLSSYPPDEPDNDVPGAVVVSLPLDKVSSFEGADSNDFYQFSVRQAGTFDLSLDWDDATVDLDVAVLNASSTAIVCRDGATSTKPERAACPLNVGTYQLGVHNSSAAGGRPSPTSYRLRAVRRR